MSNSLLTYASITKKVCMSIIGLFLSVFLLVHLFINSMLLLNDGGESFRAACEFMGTNPIIKVFEVVLFAAFILHIVLGIILWLQNKKARPIGYQKCNDSKTSLMSKFMIHTGIIILLFLVLHFINFFFVKVGIVPGIMTANGEPDFYKMAFELFKQPFYTAIYILSFLVLGFHLNHAIQSGFQSLGFEHSKYTSTIVTISTVYSLIITIGFSIIPIVILLG